MESWTPLEAQSEDCQRGRRHQNRNFEALMAWAGLGWPGLAWAGLGWPGLAWAVLGWPGLEPLAFFSRINFLLDFLEVVAYALPPRGIPRGKGPKKTLGPKEPQLPAVGVTPTPLPDRLSLTQLGKDDGSLHPNSLK